MSDELRTPDPAVVKLVAGLADELYEHTKKLFTCYSLGDTVRPTEIFGEVCAELPHLRREWATPDDLKWFAFRVIQNRILNLIRYKKSRPWLRPDGRGDVNTCASREPESAAADVIDVREAIARLEDEDPRKAKVVVLHYFTGLTFKAIADHLHVSERTVRTTFKAAVVRLSRLLGLPEPDAAPGSADFGGDDAPRQGL